MTTTAINDISDLARILAEHPEWAETLRSLLLTRELVELPEKVAQLTERVDRLILEQREIIRRLDEFIQEQREINRELRKFNQEQREINRRVDQRLARLEEIALRSEERLTNLETETGQLRIQVGNLENQVGNLEDHVGHLRGDALENRLHGNIRPLVCQRFGLRRPVVLKSRFISLDAALYEQLYEAESGGVITEDQLLQLEQADFILAAQRKESRAALYLVVEVSRTVNERDIARAHSRAATLAAATGVETLPLVIGNFIPEPQERQARELQVAVLQRPETDE